MIQSQLARTVRGKFLSEEAISHKACRVGQGPHFRHLSTRGLPCLESYFCWSPSMFVIKSCLFDTFATYPDFFPLAGRDYGYQTLHLTYTIDVVKSGMIIGMFPQPLKPCVVSLIRVALSLKSTLVLFHAWYQNFPPRFNRKLNLSDLLLRSDLRRWRSTGRTGMISRFVGPLYPFFFLITWPICRTTY
jgi:hypothetical protein